MDKLISTLAIFALVFIVVIYSAFSWGYVAHTFYLWFIIPHVPFLPTFTVVHFIGFMMFTQVMFNRDSGNHIKDEFKDKTSMYSSLIFAPWVSLLVGWILKSLVIG